MYMTFLILINFRIVSMVYIHKKNILLKKIITHYQFTFFCIIYLLIKNVYLLIKNIFLIIILKYNYFRKIYLNELKTKIYFLLRIKKNIIKFY